MSDLAWRPWGFAGLALVCAAIAVGAHTPLTALMTLHMLVQVPLLVLAGVFAEQALHARRNAGAAGASTVMSGRGKWSWNEYGLPGLLFVSLIGAAWMIPKVLDDALTDWRVALFKYVGMPLCGYLLRASVRKAPLIIRLFFLGNFCWMSAIVGITYLDQPVRLCNAYLQNDQVWTGQGLIALAIVWPLIWLLIEIKPIWRFLSR